MTVTGADISTKYRTTPVPLVENSKIYASGRCKMIIGFNPQAIYYQLKDGRISSLGYFSSKLMFDKYYSMNIDLTDTKTVVGIEDRGLMEAIFVPLNATLNIVAGAVVFGAAAIACEAEGGCR